MQQALLSRIAAAAALTIALAATASGQQQSPAFPGAVSSAIGDLEVEQLATLELPWGMAWLQDGRLLIAEKPGRLRISDGEALSEPVPGVPEVVHRAMFYDGALVPCSRSWTRRTATCRA